MSRSPTRASGAARPAPGEPSGPKRAVLLLNFGGPRNLEEVPSFLYEILRDPNTIQLPLPQWMQNRLARFIANRRAPEMARQYAAIGGNSPLVAATERIAEALRAALAAKAATTQPAPATPAQPAPPVTVAHRYLSGHAAGAVAELAAENPEAVLALPLYPHFSYATSGSSFQQARNALRAGGWRGRLSALRSYPDAPGYVAALCARLEATLEVAAPPPDSTVILCSAHGLPQAYVNRGDPYRDELYRTVQALRQRFAGWRVELSFQSRVGPAKWLRPYTDQIIPHLAREGVRHLVFVPISFVNDHIETLYEVGVTYFDLARAHGLEPYRVGAVEDHPAHIAVLADAVTGWLEGSGGEPLELLLPPGQFWRRHGPWLMTVVALAAAGAGWWALG